MRKTGFVDLRLKSFLIKIMAFRGMKIMEVWRHGISLHVWENILFALERGNL